METRIDEQGRLHIFTAHGTVAEFATPAEASGWLREQATALEREASEFRALAGRIGKEHGQ